MHIERPNLGFLTRVKEVILPIDNALYAIPEDLQERAINASADQFPQTLAEISKEIGSRIPERAWEDLEQLNYLKNHTKK